MKESVNEMVEESNLNQTEMTQIKVEVDELKEMWKKEIEHHTRIPEEFNIKDFKKEEVQDEELEEDNYETENELQTNEKPEVETQEEDLIEDDYDSNNDSQPEIPMDAMQDNFTAHKCTTIYFHHTNMQYELL